ncbi:MAG TPA: penicillin-binding protein 2 [Actinomycetota bacterium]|nr:penicillin-binding protein 2 [Actinomycetota bacterium]
MEKIDSRLRILALLVLLMFAALSTRLWFLQVLATTRFTSQAQENSVRFVETDTRRGRILDANGLEIVTNQLSNQVRVVMDELVASGRQEQVIYDLSELLDMPVEDITAALQSNKYLPYQPKPVADFVPLEVKAFIREHTRRFPGVYVEETSVRKYPQGRLAAHVLGGLSLITAEELEGARFRDYGLNDQVGRGGLEQVYERWLRGAKGEQKYIVNADGEVLRTLGHVPPEPGYDVQLAVEVETQRIAEEELRTGMERARASTDSSGYHLKASAGVVVILDPDDGGVEAMVSVPSFDPRWNVGRPTKEQRQYLNNAELSPQLNRATQGRFYPGSTFKVVSGLAAVKAGFTTIGGYAPCTTEYTHPNDTSGATFGNWKPSNSTISFGQALVESCDTWFYTFGSDFYFHWLNNQLSKDGELMQKLFREWGFGQPTGIDLPLEDAGFMATADWAAENPQVFYKGQWQPGGNILSMIGSDYFMSTPLQLARAYMAIANRGHLCRPHLADQIVDADGEVVKKIAGKCDKRLPGYTEDELAYVHEALLGVTSRGTAYCAFAGFPLSEIPVAGKTGTAENGSKQDTSWFASIIGQPNDPDHVIVAMVEQGGFGSQTAAPIVRRIIERIYGLDPNQVGCAAETAD